MNIREKMLSQDFFIFEETNFSWHDNQLFIFKEGMPFKQESAYLRKNQIFLGLTKNPLIFLNDLRLLDSKIMPDFLIFASRHSSQTARPAFLIHNTGNWGTNADFGGQPQDLSQTSALLHKAGFYSLIESQSRLNLPDFAIDIEVTHHGPTILEKPLLFMELGSSKSEWVIDDAGKFLAISIINTIFKFLEYNELKNQNIGLGFGGTHYAPNFTRLISNKEVAMSFICPKYYIQGLNKDLIKKMIDNTYETVDFFIIDWKGTNSEDKKHLMPLLEDFDIPIRKTRDF
jgi:D-aminoacyl-tRNA deacylase